jgi:riboflavin biosynthesis pyrimidine reductase
LDQDLLDELVLLIHPVIAGEGRKKLFADDTPLKKLELVSAQPTSSGVIIAIYRPVR